MDAVTKNNENYRLPFTGTKLMYHSQFSRPLGRFSVKSRREPKYGVMCVCGQNFPRAPWRRKYIPQNFRARPGAQNSYPNFFRASCDPPIPTHLIRYAILNKIDDFAVRNYVYFEWVNKIARRTGADEKC